MAELADHIDRRHQDQWLVFHHEYSRTFRSTDLPCEGRHLLLPFQSLHGNLMLARVAQDVPNFPGECFAGIGLGEEFHAGV